MLAARTVRRALHRCGLLHQDEKTGEFKTDAASQGLHAGAGHALELLADSLSFAELAARVKHAHNTLKVLLRPCRARKTVADRLVELMQIAA